MESMIFVPAFINKPISCIINNLFVPWVCDVADEPGIPSALL